MNMEHDDIKKSAAITLSDMEMFIFPELIYSLVLANIMSPRIWKWRDDPWFAGLERMKPYKRINRLKQFIMDHYVFNLDLDTWGLTTKEAELARFSEIISEDVLAQSNALFGYEGDKYYFDIDIRSHFGLDKYQGNIIPYWKTETVEAMDAFQYKPNYNTGAGECVSLATLYAAALFIVARIPLEDIFLMATPLHSQNFVDINDGLLTNNRRLVTKTMWFNGTALSAQARRALENERVTIVAHETGTIHTLYEDATIAPPAYERFSARMRDFLTTPLTDELLGNFLRHEQRLQKCFQVRWELHGTSHYIGIERVLAYEHGSPYRITDNTREKLLADIEMEEYKRTPLPGRIILNDLEEFVKKEQIDMYDETDVGRLKKKFVSDCLNAEIAIESLIGFCHVKPRLPVAGEKKFVSGHDPLGLDIEMTREDMIERLENISTNNELARMAFYAYRDLIRTEPGPFLEAAYRRNPVCIAAAADLDDAAIWKAVEMMDEQSIYDDPGRLAQPDEVWNYGRGDGVEKAVMLACIMTARYPDRQISITVAPDKAVLDIDGDRREFSSVKGLKDAQWPVATAVVGEDGAHFA